MGDVVVPTQDWHCEDHVSFASQHSGVAEFQTITLNYDENGTLCHNPQDATDDEYTCSDEDIAHQVNQVMWPDHCVSWLSKVARSLATCWMLLMCFYRELHQ